MKKNPKPNRLKLYNYSQDGFYFVTICVKNHEKAFGEITSSGVKLNEFGKIAQQQWLWLAEQYKYIKLDEFIIMPNHLHGIIIIDQDQCNYNPRIVITTDDTMYNRRHNLLSKTINAFKTTTSIKIHSSNFHSFQWQRSFYDHIIRHEKSLENIRNYIKFNYLKDHASLKDDQKFIDSL